MVDRLALELTAGAVVAVGSAGPELVLAILTVLASVACGLVVLALRALRARRGLPNGELTIVTWCAVERVVHTGIFASLARLTSDVAFPPRRQSCPHRSGRGVKARGTRRRR
jgi:hypothetical protein